MSITRKYNDTINIASQCIRSKVLETKIIIVYGKSEWFCQRKKSIYINKIQYAKKI